MSKFTNDYLKPLVGSTIIDAWGMVDDEDEVWPTLLVEDQTGQQRIVCMMRDPEGNGPGWPTIEKATV